LRVEALFVEAASLGAEELVSKRLRKELTQDWQYPDTEIIERR